jgi:hypothetical protein
MYVPAFAIASGEMIASSSFFETVAGLLFYTAIVSVDLRSGLYR